jgi:hypothetical protein
MSMAMGALGGLTSLAGTIGGMFASGDAAKAMEDAAGAAQGYITSTASKAAGYQTPYMNLGSQAAGTLGTELNQLTAAYNPTVSQLESTPGYQFDLSQGLESTQNGFAAKGLGVSGAALKGAANYATGLAQNTYAQQAQIYNQNQQRAYNMLIGSAGLGQQAATTAGNDWMQTIDPYTSALYGGANAKASGIMAPWNGLTSLGNSMMGQSSSGTGISDIASML